MFHTVNNFDVIKSTAVEFLDDTTWFSQSQKDNMPVHRPMKVIKAKKIWSQITGQPKGIPSLWVSHENEENDSVTASSSVSSTSPDSTVSNTATKATRGLCSAAFDRCDSRFFVRVRNRWARRDSGIQTFRCEWKMPCKCTLYSHLYLELVMVFDLLSERCRQWQQATLVNVETAVLVAADDMEGERWAVPGRVFVRHHKLEDAAADWLAFLQDTLLIISNVLFSFLQHILPS